MQSILALALVTGITLAEHSNAAAWKLHKQQLKLEQPQSRDPIDLAGSVVCTFLYGQDLSRDSLTKLGGDARLWNFRDVKNKTPMEWTFLDLGTKKPTFLSGGDKGSVVRIKHTHDEGVSLLLPMGTGASLFTIWPDGGSLFTKHNSLFGLHASQQYVGSCKNLRETD